MIVCQICRLWILLLTNRKPEGWNVLCKHCNPGCHWQQCSARHWSWGNVFMISIIFLPFFIPSISFNSTFCHAYHGKIIDLGYNYQTDTHRHITSPKSAVFCTPAENLKCEKNNVCSVILYISILVYAHTTCNIKVVYMIFFQHT